MNQSKNENTALAQIFSIKTAISVFISMFFIAFGHVQAQELSNYWPPSEETQSENQMTIDHIGSAMRYYGNKPAYIASLYSEDSFPNTAVLYSNDGTKELQLIIVDEAMSSRRLKRIIKNDLILTLKDDDYNQLQPKVNKLLSSLNTDLAVGSLITIAYDSLRDATIVRLDKERKATIDGKELFTATLKSMVGKRPPSREFKDGLLGHQMPTIDLTIEQELLVTQYIDQQYLQRSLQRSSNQQWMVDSSVTTDF